MKCTIKWHKQSLENSVKYYQVKRSLAEDELLRCEEGEAGCQHYAKQIAEALRRGMNGFDADRFMKSTTKTQEEGDKMKQEKLPEEKVKAIGSKAKYIIHKKKMGKTIKGQQIGKTK